MKIPVVFLLLAAGLEAVLSEDKYFEIGGKLSLKPESVPGEGIIEITWKFNRDLVAEWNKDTVPLSYFREFKGRTDLDTTTGELTIRSMTKADEGIFSVEINSKVQPVEYSARGITHLRDKKVEVLLRPVACTFSSPQCTLSCQADVADVGPVQYSWQQDEGQWKELQKDMNINNDEETRLIKTFSCKIKNPISEKNSEPLENPFIKKSEEQSHVGLTVGIIFLLLLIVAGVALSVFAYKYPEKVAPCLHCVTGAPDQRPTEEPPDDGEKREVVCLNTESNTKTSSKTPEELESHDMTPLKGPETGTSNGTPAPQHSGSSVTVHLNTEANTKTKYPEEIAPCLPCVTGPPDQRPTDEPPDDGEKSEVVCLNTESEIETSNKTPPDPDESSETTPLKGPGTSNGTPDQS